MWGQADPKDTKRREAPILPGFLLLCICLPPLSLPCVNWANQEGCWFCLRSSLQFSDLPLFYFCGLSPSFSFSHHHFWLLFPILTPFSYSNTSKEQAAFNFMAAITIYSDQIKPVTVSIVSPSICHEVMGPDALIRIWYPHSPQKNGWFVWIITAVYKELKPTTQR